MLGYCPEEAPWVLVAILDFSVAGVVVIERCGTRGVA